jgi:hypothetical protein
MVSVMQRDAEKRRRKGYAERREGKFETRIGAEERVTQRNAKESLKR